MTMTSVVKRTMSASTISSTTFTSYHEHSSSEIGSGAFSTRVVDSSLILKLEGYDDDIAGILQELHEISPCDNDSSEEQESSSKRVYSVNRFDLNRVSLIGSGQFCNVYSVTGSLEPGTSDQHQQQQVRRKRFMYACKSIDYRRVRTSEDLFVAATDLANEAILLSQLNHKNIIGLRGLCNEGFSQSFESDADTSGEGYFLVLDILKETLTDRLHRWRKQHIKTQTKRLSLNIGGSSIRKTKKFSYTNADDCQRHIMYRRIENTVFGIAEGMEYLHSQQIVLRDLKPRNIGYDYTTNTIPKLFDFGFARRLSDCNAQEICGSPRYMAPEAMDGSGYTLKVDVFSFGVVLFEICSLCVPYADNYWNWKNHPRNKSFAVPWKNLARMAGRSKKKNKTKNSPRNHNFKKAKCSLESQLDDFYTAVVRENLRPTDDLEDAIPFSKIRGLIKDCWETNPNNRPTFPEILTRLSTIFARQEKVKRSTSQPDLSSYY